ncbi:TPA: hypothetical protein DDW35_00705 [Candidatus Sumerlaeota bacterium]|jgi:4-amino-4-deoxy-L-arabinose transferase-like glycosyltransferase|nr:hypothetical protein [Candidatus Sumerlaeota bacterium]
MRRFFQPDRPLFVIATLVIIWIGATVANFNKAYHIDDTAYLEVAQWVTVHPLHPMQGMVNWGNVATPISAINQPPLYSYCLAIWGLMFGLGEISTHLMQSLFTLAAIAFFYGLARKTVPQHALLVSALFGLCPPLITGQNIMTDVPMLAFWNAFYFVLLAWSPRSESTRYGVAGLIAGVAILIKYTSLILLPAILLHMFLSRNRRQWPWLGIPLAIIATWSAFNVWDCGQIHILNRAVTFEARSTHLLCWLITLGAIAPQAFVFYMKSAQGLRSRAFWTGLIILAFSIVILVLPAYHFNLISRTRTVDVLYISFLLNGTILAWMLMRRSIRLLPFQLEKTDLVFRPDAQDINLLSLLHYWMWASSLFVLFFAPFMAVRHVLPSIPPLLLILAYNGGLKTRLRWRMTTVILTVVLSSCLALSDWNYANAYREGALNVACQVSPKSRIWFVGHWGWQYYAKKAGMLQLTGSRPEAQPGDVLIRPAFAQIESIAPTLQTRTIRYLASSPQRAFMPSVDRASLYATTLPLLPWHPSRQAFEIISIEEIISNTTPLTNAQPHAPTAP